MPAADQGIRGTTTVPESSRVRDRTRRDMFISSQRFIGALAGIGLRLSGNDGKIRCKFELKESNLSVAELLGLNFIEAVADENFKPLSPDELVNLISALKPVFLDFKLRDGVAGRQSVSG